MKFLPIIILALVAVGAAYLFYYKPQREKAQAEKDAAIAANDAALTTVADPMAGIRARMSRLTTPLATKSTLTAKALSI